MSHHRAIVYNSFEEYAEDYEDKRKARIRWNRHVKRNGNVPLVVKCSICSGKALQHDIKEGKFKMSTREDQKWLKNEESKEE